MNLKFIAFSVIAMLPFSMMARDLSDWHLNSLPRTQEERARIAAVIAPTEDFTQAEPFEINQGGATTVRDRDTADAFSHPSANMSFEREADFKLGNGLFRKLWVSSPSSTLASDGLGPLFNARSCQRCHLKDGRGHPPESNQDTAISIFLRVSIPGGDPVAGIEGYFPTQPDPVYGSQLQDFAVQGHAAEYRFQVDYTEELITMADGYEVSLRHPVYTPANLGYGPLSEDIMLSPRVANQMIGLGLLEAIPVEDILVNADPDDTDGDGISGRVNIVWSLEFEQIMLGRFGLKAGAPTLRQQSAAAFSGDIGISNPLFPAGAGECTELQPECLSAPDGNSDIHGGFEISDESLDLVTFYASNLAVPARRDVDDPTVLAGKSIFYQSGCTDCHIPKFVTARLSDHSEQSFQLIWPYSDLLLHDMGSGLADNRPEARANGQEWRTPPLWGIGLTEQVSGHSYFLHDGRARSLLEAIMWHGGEATAAREAVRQLPAKDRDALIKFLESL